MIDKLEDKLSNGIILGLISISICALITYCVKIIVVSQVDIIDSMLPSRLQMITLAINILLFRFLIKKEKMETAKGLFSVLFMAVLLYIVNMKYNFI